MAYNELFDNIPFGYYGDLTLSNEINHDEAMKKLVYIFNTRNVKCIKLNLNRNMLINDGLIELSKYLKVNNTIKHLSICKNRFDIECMDEFVDMLKYNGFIITLYMDWYNIGDVGTIKLIDALKYNTTLTSLYLHNCDITDNGAKEIIKMLEYNYTLQTVMVQFNIINRAHVIEINNMLQMPYRLNRKGWYVYDHKFWDQQMKDIIYNMVMINNTDVNTLSYLPNELMYLIFYFIKN